MIAMANKAYSYIIKSPNAKLDGMRKRTIAGSKGQAMEDIRNRIRDLYSLSRFALVQPPIIMSIERVTSDTAMFSTVSELHQGYVVVKHEKTVHIVYLHYETAIRYSAGGIVVPYKIAKHKYA